MNVTNGTIEYGRTTRPADFESKSAKVSLAFAIDDGADPAAAMAKVFDMAVAEVHRRLGIAFVDKPIGEYGKSPAAAALPEVKAENARKATKAPPPAEVGSNLVKVDATTEADIARHIAEDAAAVTPPAEVVPEVVPTPSAGPIGAASASAIDAIEEPEAVPAAVPEEKPITDKDLHTAVHLAMERKVANKVIKDLVAKYTGVAGKSMTLIAVDKRPAFLAEIRAA